MKRKFVYALRAVCLFESGAMLAPAALMEEEAFAVDLSNMSDLMIYGMMFDVVSKPQDYEGKRMRLVGVYSPFKNPDTGEMEHTLIFYDITYCCEVELRVYMKDEYQYPKDFPRDGEKMTVTGTLRVEGEGKKAVCWLEDGAME